MLSSGKDCGKVMDKLVERIVFVKKVARDDGVAEDSCGKREIWWENCGKKYTQKLFNLQIRVVSFAARTASVTIG